MNDCPFCRCIVIGPTPEQQYNKMMKHLEEHVEDVMKNFHIPLPADSKPLRDRVKEAHNN